jgi:hypothetical protein
LDEVNDGCHAFLIEDFEDEDDANEAINAEWDVFFETWLESWVDDETAWPKKRTVELFYEWFDVGIHSMVFDRLDEPILHEEEFSQAPAGSALH